MLHWMRVFLVAQVCHQLGWTAQDHAMAVFRLQWLNTCAGDP